MRLENKGNNPLLVQSWLDTGDDNAEPGSITVPFTATPPVSRIDAKRGQTIKLMYTASSALPKDRESVFWFNVLEVPPKPDAAKAANQSLLQLAFRTRIKLFYRPEGLSGIPSDAPLALKWSWATSEGKAALRVDNPTPYYVSFSSGDLEANGKRYPLDVKMIAPFSNDVIKVNGMSGRTSSAKVHFSPLMILAALLKATPTFNLARIYHSRKQNVTIKSTKNIIITLPASPRFARCCIATVLYALNSSNMTIHF